MSQVAPAEIPAFINLWKARCRALSLFSEAVQKFIQLNLEKTKQSWGWLWFICPFLLRNTARNKSIFKCSAELDVSEGNRASYFSGRVKGTQPQPVSGCTHADDATARHVHVCQQAWGRCHSQRLSARAVLANGKSWLDGCFGAWSFLLLQCVGFCFACHNVYANPIPLLKENMGSGEWLKSFGGNLV